MIIRALVTSTFVLGQRAPHLQKQEEFYIPEADITHAMENQIRAYVTAGQMRIVNAGTLNFMEIRQTVRNQAVVLVGVAGTLPNGATLHTLTLGGVEFVLGDGNIDGANTSLQLAALKAAILASDDFAATKAKLAASGLLGSLVAASGTLTSNNTNVSAADTVTVGGQTYTFRATAKATGTLTSDGTAPTEGDTVTIGNKTYTFMDTLTPLEGEVLIGASAATALDNLKAAVNHDGVPDTDYSCAAAHTQVIATTNTNTTQVFEALTAGVGGNSIATTEAGTHTSFGAATLTGGDSPDAAYEVNIGADADASLLNLIRAINLTGTGDGTDYFGTGMVANANVSAASSVTSHAFAVTARVAGAVGNSIGSTKSATTLSWSAATLANGADVTAFLVINGDDVDDWTAWKAASAITGGTDATLTEFTSADNDEISTDTPVFMEHTATADDVTRGFVLFETGLSTVNKFDVKITRSGVAVVHDGDQLLSDSTVLVRNNGSTDFAAADVIQVVARGVRS